MNKHRKSTPARSDLKDNPLIGGSKGSGMAKATPEDLESAEAENTVEGDLENDTNPQGGIDKATARSGRNAPHGK